MDPNQLQQMLRDADAALERGDYTQAEIDAYLKENTQFPTLGALRIHVLNPEDMTEGQRTLAEGGSGAGDAATLAANSVTLGFADELLGLFSPEAGRKMRERVGAIRSENPVWATLPLEIAAGAALPGGAALGAARGGALGRAAITGAATGIAAGAAAGAGEAEGSFTERLPEAGVGALIAGLGGAVAAPAGRVGQATIQRFRGSPNSRLARGLADIAGDSEASESLFGRVRATMTGGRRARDIYTPDAIRQQHRNALEETGQRVYQQFDSMGPSRELRRMVSRMAAEPGIRSSIQDVGVRRDLFGGPPDFTNLRRIRNNLETLSRKENDPNGTFTRLFHRFDQEMEVSFPGISEANREYARAAEVGEAFEMGFRRSRRSGRSRIEGMAGWQRPSEVREALRTFDSNPEAQTAMRQGMRHRLIEDLFQTRDEVPRQIKIFMNADEGGEAMMRELFEQGPVGDEKFGLFRRLVNENASPETIMHQLQVSAKWGAILAGAGAAGVAGTQAARDIFRD